MLKNLTTEFLTNDDVLACEELFREACDRNAGLPTVYDACEALKEYLGEKNEKFVAAAKEEE